VVLPTPGELADALRADGVEVLIRPMAVLRRELLSPRGLASLGSAVARDGRGLSRVIRDRGIALVHSNTSVVLGGATAAALTRVPHIWHVREIYARFASAWPLHRRLLLSAQALACVSRATAAQFGGDPKPLVISDGLAVDARRAPRALARRALGLDPNAPVIAVLGRISDWKGQDVLVRALAEPGLRSRGAIGVLAGEPWPGAEERLHRVVELARRLGVEDRLVLAGFRPDVDTVYGAADIVAVPSTQPDPLPGAAVEAAAAGCAVIASDHGGLPEIIREGVTGRLIPPGDPVALASAAATLIDAPAERERLGAAAAADARARFAPERLIASVEALYDSLLTAR
jgi:glycosyltransferase involved in cell wall biosynthesis